MGFVQWSIPVPSIMPINCIPVSYESRHEKTSVLHMRKQFAYAKTKTQISFAVTAKLISTFVFATQIVRSLYFLNPKFQASSERGSYV